MITQSLSLSLYLYKHIADLRHAHWQLHVAQLARPVARPVDQLATLADNYKTLGADYKTFGLHSADDVEGDGAGLAKSILTKTE